jgi:hypothetical protein
VKQSPVLGTTDLSQLAKPAALLFDKIFAHPKRAEELGVPEEITFYYPEVINSMIDQVDWEAARETLNFFLNPPAQLETLMDNAHGVSLRNLCRGHARQGIKVVPLYRSEVAFSAEFSSGDGTAYQAILSNMPVVAPQELEWRQILEFRQDPDALRKYRALRVWMQEALVTKTLSEATDVVGAKIEDYEWTLRKHGFKTITATISEVLSSKTLAAATAAGGLMALVSQPVWALLAAGSLVVSKVAISIAERSIEAEDLRRGENTAIAAICEIRSITSGD